MSSKGKAKKATRGALDEDKGVGAAAAGSQVVVEVSQEAALDDVMPVSFASPSQRRRVATRGDDDKSERSARDQAEAEDGFEPVRRRERAQRRAGAAAEEEDEEEEVPRRKAATVVSKDLPPMAAYAGAAGAFASWHRDFVNRASVLEWSDAKTAKMLRAYLTGKAQDVIDDLPQDASIDEVVERLHDAFEAPLAVQSYRLDLARIRQGAGEKVMEYAIRVRALAGKLAYAGSRVSDRDLHTHFVGGLLPMYLGEFYLKPATSFAGAIKYAVGLEMRKKMEKAEAPSSVTAVFVPRPGRRGFRGACFKCQQPGHKAAECKAPATGTAGATAGNAASATRGATAASSGESKAAARPKQHCTYCGGDSHTQERCFKREREQNAAKAVNMLSTVNIPSAAAPIIQVFVKGHALEMLLDSGADIDIVSGKTFDALRSAGVEATLVPTDLSAKSAGQQVMRFRGVAELTFVLEGASHRGRYYVSDDFAGQLLLGNVSMDALDVSILWRSHRARFVELGVSTPLMERIALSTQVTVTLSESVESEPMSSEPSEPVTSEAVGSVVVPMEELPSPDPQSLVVSVDQGVRAAEWRAEPPRVIDTAPESSAVVTSVPSVKRVVRRDGRVTIWQRRVDMVESECPLRRQNGACIYTITAVTPERPSSASSVVEHANDLAVEPLDEASLAELGVDTPPVQELGGRVALELAMAAETVTEQERRELLVLLVRCKRAFVSADNPIGHVRNFEMDIETGDAEPVFTYPYRLARVEQEAVEKEVQAMLAAGVIRPSTSPWCSVLLLIRKKDGTWRVCVDFRKLNLRTVPYFFQLPRVDAQLAVFAGCAFFTRLDCHSAYWQVKLTEEASRKTAFTCPLGHFEFVSMPFGLRNGPTVFQKLMQAVFGDLIGRELVVYLDDIVVYSKTWQQHVRTLAVVFERLEAVNLKLKPAKCAFAQRELIYLGHLVSQSGIAVDPAKIAAIRGFPRPANVRQLRSFIGLANYYRNFVEGYARLCRPLNALLSKTAVWLWTPDHENAFERIKDALCSAPVLCHPDSQRRFTVQTDASDVAVGAVLCQKDEEGRECVVSYLSRALTEAERKYAAHERELLGVVYALEVFRPYLLGQRFDLETDNAAVTFLLRNAKPGRLARWAVRLAEFEFDLRHRKGVSNPNADALSRIELKEKERKDELIEDDREFFNAFQVEVTSVSVEELRKAQATDPLSSKVLASLRAGRPGAHKLPWVLKDSLLLLEGHAGLRGVSGLRLYVPESLRRRVMDQFHLGSSAGHVGRARMLFSMRSRVFWPRMARDVARYLKHCLDCTRAKLSRDTQAGLLQPFTTSGPFSMVSLDIVGPLPVTVRGHRYYLALLCRFTRWLELVPLSEATAKAVADAFFDFVCRYGVPARILTDRGSVFMSDFFSQLCSRLNVRHLRTTAYHPRTNGQNERSHRFVGEVLRILTDFRASDWDLCLQPAAAAFRNGVIDRMGVSPYQAVFGKSPVLPFDVEVMGDDEVKFPSAEQWSEDVSARLRAVWSFMRSAEQDLMAMRAERVNASRKPVRIKVGDSVMLYTPIRHLGYGTKLRSPWTGPFKVSAVDGNTVVLATSNGPSRVNVDRLKVTPIQPSSAVPVPVAPSDFNLEVGSFVVLRRQKLKPEVFLARIAEVGPVDGDLTVVAYNSYCRGALATRSFKMSQWSESEQLEVFDNGRRAGFEPYTSIVFAADVVLPSFQLPASGRLPVDVVSAVRALGCVFPLTTTRKARAGSGNGGGDEAI